jgi:Fe-S cluster biogenesis protein NfuA
MSTTLAIQYVEPTPNPNAFKFRVGETLLAEGQANFPSPVEAEELPIARALFELGDITAVLIAEDFISVSGNRATYWQKVREIIEEGLKSLDVAAVAAVAANRADAAVRRQADNMQNPYFQQIHDVFETYVRPALAGDGGGIELVGVEEKIVQIRYQGACGSCPTSTATTLNAIENLLHDKVDPELRLQPV